MPWGLHRFQETGHSHFVTFSCYRRRLLLSPEAAKRTFEGALERVRRSFHLRIYAYVIMPEHVHLLMSEPDGGLLADVIKSLKQGVSRRLVGDADHFWQKRYYDFNIRNYRQFVEKRRYIHRNPVKRGLCEHGKVGSGAAFVSARPDAEDEWRSNASGRPEGANEQRGHFAPQSKYPTQANTGLEWATRPTHFAPTVIAPNGRAYPAASGPIYLVPDRGTKLITFP